MPDFYAITYGGAVLKGPTSDGSSGQYLKTDGSGNLSFDTLAITAINSAAENRLVTVGATTTELDAESTLTYDGSTLAATNILVSANIAFSGSGGVPSGGHGLTKYATYTKLWANASYVAYRPTVGIIVQAGDAIGWSSSTQTSGSGTPSLDTSISRSAAGIIASDAIEITADTNSMTGLTVTSAASADANSPTLQLNLGSGQVGNALEVNSSGGSGGDLAYFDSSGYLAIGRALLSGSEFTAGNTAIGDTNIFQRGANMIGWSAGALDASPVVGLAKYDAGILAVTNGSSAKIASPASVTIVGESGSGTDISGATLQVGGGIGTGTGTDGGVTIVGAPATGSSSTLNTQQPLATLGINGEITAAEQTDTSATSDFVIAASDAATGGGQDGASIYLTPGAGDGVGASGSIVMSSDVLASSDNAHDIGSTSAVFSTSYIRTHAFYEFSCYADGNIGDVSYRQLLMTAGGNKGLHMASGATLTWNANAGSGSDGGNPAFADVGLKRNAAGVLEVTAGKTGTGNLLLAGGYVSITETDSSATPLTVTSAASQQAGSPVFVVNETSGSGNIAEFQVGGTAKVEIDSSGQVGVGGAPSSLFHVQGTGDIRYRVQGTTNVQADFYEGASERLAIGYSPTVNYAFLYNSVAAKDMVRLLDTGVLSLQPVSGNTQVGGDLIADEIIRQDAEVTSTPSGTTQTITLDDANHQTLDLSSSTGDVTVTLTVPTSSAAGTLIIKQHASTARDITWSPSAGSIVWLGTEPTWNGDGTSTYRVVSWRFNGTNTFLASTASGS